MAKFLLISIKPEFANKILSKNKLIELRKNKPNAQIGDYVLIYSTVPDKAVIGFAQIKRIIETSPTSMWQDYSNILGIDKFRFNEYYSDNNKAIGIELSYICKLRSRISLKDIKTLYPKFSPPQTYKYIPYFSALRVYRKAIS